PDTHRALDHRRAAACRHRTGDASRGPPHGRVADPFAVTEGRHPLSAEYEFTILGVHALSVMPISASPEVLPSSGHAVDARRFHDRWTSSLVNVGRAWTFMSAWDRQLPDPKVTWHRSRTPSSGSSCRAGRTSGLETATDRVIFIVMVRDRPERP